MHISARSDYAVRAMLAIADAVPQLITAPELASRHRIPLGFLHGILAELRRSGLVHSQRGLSGGYTLARAAAEITIGDVLRATSGTLTTVRGLPPALGDYPGPARPLRQVWLATEEAIRDVVDTVSLADVLGGAEPAGARSARTGPGASDAPPSLVAPLLSPGDAGSGSQPAGARSARTDPGVSGASTRPAPS